MLQTNFILTDKQIQTFEVCCCQASVLKYLILTIITSGQSNLKKAVSPHTAGLVVFARWRQCAPHVTMLPWVYPSSQPKGHLDWFSHFWILHSLRQSVIEHVLSPKNCPLAWSDLDPHLVHDSLSPYEPTHKSIGILIGSAVLQDLWLWQNDRQNTL